jgi:predicted RNA-binding Zn ribbon-like protein
MAVLWNKHRFSGGLLILDVTNTVVLRGDRQRSFDRFADSDEIASFAAVASVFRAAELGGRPLVFEWSATAVREVIELREAADRLFRTAVMQGAIQTRHLADVLRASACCLDGTDEKVGGPRPSLGDPPRPMQFTAALALSALSLISGQEWSTVRICPNCNWLFVDRSRNASRLWCDMSVCGNRHKAKLHYQRRKAAEKEDANV